jgi:hypothetical protein
MKKMIPNKITTIKKKDKILNIKKIIGGEIEKHL